MKSFILALALFGAHSALVAAEGHAHVHGVAKLDVAVEGPKVTVHLDSPLANIVGFERAPRTDAERKLAAGAVARLKSADTMFRFDPTARCSASKIELSSSALNLGTPDPAEQVQGHADIDGDFEFECADAGKATFLEVGLFQFEHLQRIEVRIATPQGQFRRDVARPSSRISLSREPR